LAERETTVRRGGLRGGRRLNMVRGRPKR
jgi:hypothetical protein